ncbi:MAG: ParB/RepB/Spo0J family partition protein [Deltaproteobacteria bacterium]|nr:MAG: ParB/RepB/Spo0J family partition protein [Deltaproteobacteria bacterium]TMB30621.1 MAG: ParB/RepB/Spo0J family partition protein [Deltaproteobacteria bacterium]TMB38079.1 MAG: ParB/RepB/Spo0J family partition protein [Deltaproteobacteria bacterium]
MEKAMKRAALGRGLGALIPGVSAGERRGVVTVAIEEIRPSPGQPRRHFDDAHLEELGESIRSRGVLLPLLVRRDGDGYLLIAGERRWRAAQRAGLHELPVIVRDVTEPEAFEIALIENIQREDLNAVEEAEAYQRLIEHHGLTQEELAQRVGKDRSTIANAIRLLRLPDSIKEAVASGDLSMGHARALLGLTDDGDLRKAAEKVMREDLSVRQVEELVQRLKGKRAQRARRDEATTQLRHLAERLQRKLGAKVDLKDRGGSGSVEIRYASHAELDRIISAILGEG